MLSTSVLSTAVWLGLANALPLPLNINLGAYSPALVVGDGEMSFSGANNVANLMNTLQGASVAGAAAAAAAPAAAPAAAEAATLPATRQGVVVAESSPLAEPAAVPLGGFKQLDPRPRSVESEGAKVHNVQKRQVAAGFDRALQYAEAALVKGPKVSLGTGEGGAGVGIIVDNNINAAQRAGSGQNA